VLAGACLYFAPNGAVSSVRGEIMDVLHPAQFAISRAKEIVSNSFRTEEHSSQTANAKNVAQLKEELAYERERNRAFQIRLAQLAERQITELESSPASKRSQRLMIPLLLEVGVLGDTLAEQWRAGKLLDLGAKNGLKENELVLAPHKPLRPLIDMGEDADLSTEDALLLGRCVIGKVEHVGRWTSTFQLVTDSRFRGRAQLIRETESGFVFESQGIIKGQGSPQCKLEGIPAEKSVRVNDTVYTAERDGIMPTPLYYGHVVEAVLGPDDREWTVLVKPADLPTRLTRVQVLRAVINPERLVVK
jgi:cell shape-determining protein MreC